MKISTIQRKHFFLVGVVAITIILAYWGLQSTFFLQDEWQTLAGNTYYLSKGIKGIFESFLPIYALSHFNPAAIAYTWFNHIFFYTNFSPYAWSSIILHIVNATLLYYLVFSWIRSKKIAFFAAIFFGVNSIPHQAVTWVAAANSYEIPVAFMLLSLVFFQRFLIQVKHKRKNIVFSLFMLFISLLFHEVGIFLFFFYPVTFLLYTKSRERKILPFFLFSLTICIGIFFLIRVPFFFGLTTSLPELTDISRPPVLVYPYRFISVVMKSFAGSLLSEKNLIGASDVLTYLAYPQFMTADNIPNPYVSQSVVFDFVSYVLTLIIICFLFVFKRFVHEKRTYDAFVWSALFVPASLLVYGFVLGKAGYASILEPKFYYVSSIGVSILVAIIFDSLSRKFSSSKILQGILYVLFGVCLVGHMYSIKTYIRNLESISATRKAFLTDIKKSYSTLPTNVIFYTLSDSTYYGMPDEEKTLPVQIGFGKMLMVWYQTEERFPGCLYEEQFLLHLLAEGYRSCEGRGFGYFRDYEKLIKSVKENGIAIENIIGYSWADKTKKFRDITVELQKRIDHDLTTRSL